MPSTVTVLAWLSDGKHSQFLSQYTRAREAQADALVEECMEIADDGTNDWMERRSEAEKGAGVSTGWTLNGEHVQRSRLRVDTRKWWAARLAPKKYGDKVALSGDAENPVEMRISWARTQSEGTADPSKK